MSSDSRSPLHAARDRTRAPRHEFLTFTVGGREYTTNISAVQALLDYDSVKPVADGSPPVAGVCTLRGQAVPVIDLRLALDVRPPRFDHLTAVAVLEIQHRKIGIVIDEVFDAVTLDPGQIRAHDRHGHAASNGGHYLIGTANLSGREVHLIDLERMLTDFGLDRLDKIAA